MQFDCIITNVRYVLSAFIIDTLAMIFNVFVGFLVGSALYLAIALICIFINVFYQEKMPGQTGMIIILP